MVSGVPQGTLLGTLLFLLHINDLPSVVSSKVRLFADDCLIYSNINNKEVQIALQKDLNLLENWDNTWGMRLNAAKRNIRQVSRTHDPRRFSYSLTWQVLEEVMDTKYFMVIIIITTLFTILFLSVNQRCNRSTQLLLLLVRLITRISQPAEWSQLSSLILLYCCTQ